MPRLFPPFRITPPGIVARLTTPAPWRPMTDEEWEQVMHFMVFVHPGPGRQTIMGARRALDACFHAACFPGPWRALPAAYGKPDTIHRMFRRWAHAGLWSMLLKFVAKERPGLAAVQYWVCRAFRRAHRILGLGGVVLARRLGMDTALRAPSWYLPDPDLSATFHNRCMPPVAETLMDQPRGVIRGTLRFWRQLYGLMIGRRAITRFMAPP